MKTINITINDKTRDISKILLSEIIFGSLYFDNSISKIEKSVIEIEGVSSESVKVFFDFIQNQDRFIDPQKFIESYEKTDDQNLYELMIIFDYFNSSLLDLVCTILRNKPTSSLNTIKNEMYEHINVMYNEMILERTKPDKIKFYIDETTIYVKRGSIEFCIYEPYIRTHDDWRDFLEKLRSEPEKSFIRFGWLSFEYDSDKNLVSFCCECRGGQGGDGFLSTGVPLEEFCDALEELLNSEKFGEIYNF